VPCTRRIYRFYVFIQVLYKIKQPVLVFNLVLKAFGNERPRNERPAFQYFLAIYTYAIFFAKAARAGESSHLSRKVVQLRTQGLQDAVTVCSKTSNTSRTTVWLKSVVKFNVSFT
jgi:hypothetical protein